MTHAEVEALVADACAESTLHASYTFKAKQYEAAAFAVQALLIGVRERLAERPMPLRRYRRRAVAAPAEEGTPNG